MTSKYSAVIDKWSLFRGGLYTQGDTDGWRGNQNVGSLNRDYGSTLVFIILDHIKLQYLKANNQIRLKR